MVHSNSTSNPLYTLRSTPIRSQAHPDVKASSGFFPKRSLFGIDTENIEAPNSHILVNSVSHELNYLALWTPPLLKRFLFHKSCFWKIQTGTAFSEISSLPLIYHWRPSLTSQPGIITQFFWEVPTSLKLKLKRKIKPLTYIHLDHLTIFKKKMLNIIVNLEDNWFLIRDSCTSLKKTRWSLCTSPPPAFPNSRVFSRALGDPSQHSHEPLVVSWTSPRRLKDDVKA